MEKVIITRRQLYEMVWTDPLSRLAKKYDISDNGLRKICKRIDIPLPDNGYWQKIQYNKPAVRKELPKDYKGPNEVNLVERKEENPINADSYSIKSILKSYEAYDQSIFKVPARLTNPDELIIAAQKTLSSQKASEWSNYMVKTYSGEIAIKVAPANVSRALRLFDAIIRILRFKFYDIIVRGVATYVIVEGVNIEIAIREKLRIEKTVDKNSWNTNKYFPTGRLIIKVNQSYCAKEFIDGEKSLEEKLPLIIAEIEYLGQKGKQRRIESAIFRKQYEEKLQLEKDLKDRKDKELNTFKNLLNESKTWHKSVILDNYIKEREKRAIETNTLTDDLKTWLSWAKQKADWYNPFIKKEDEFLNEQDRHHF